MYLRKIPTSFQGLSHLRRYVWVEILSILLLLKFTPRRTRSVVASRPDIDFPFSPETLHPPSYEPRSKLRVAKLGTMKFFTWKVDHCISRRWKTQYILSVVFTFIRFHSCDRKMTGIVEKICMLDQQISSWAMKSLNKSISRSNMKIINNWPVFSIQRETLIWIVSNFYISAGNAAENGYFGPWRQCKLLLYGRERCEQGNSRFRPVSKSTTSCSFLFRNVSKFLSGRNISRSWL